MFAVTVTFQVNEEYGIAQARNSLMNEQHCHQFDVCIDPSDPRRVLLYEVYTDSATFDVHLKTAHFKDFDNTVKP